MFFKERIEAFNPNTFDHLPEYRDWYKERSTRLGDDISTWLEDRTFKKQSQGWRSEFELSDEEEQKDVKEEKEQEVAKPVYKSVTKSSFIGLTRYSPYLFLNINYFAHVGGIKMLFDLIKNSRNIGVIASALEIIKDLYYYLEDKYAEEEIIEKIKKPLQALPKLLSDDDIKKSLKEDISRLLKLMEVSKC